MSDGKIRCWWCGDDPLYIRYHDEEWGRPVTGDVRLFEKLCLEGFQAGLSWITILRKRENFRKAFANFNLRTVSRFSEQDVSRLLNDSGIIRHRGKITSAINNAGRALELIEEFGSLHAYFGQFVPGDAERPQSFDPETVKATAKTATSLAISKDLKNRGWSFVGPTTIYAFMQAMGMVNDHVADCFCRAEIEQARRVAPAR